MADNAFQTQYRDEFIAGFEVRQSVLRSAVTTDGEINGNTYTFLIADSGSTTAVTRGTNGLIPARADNLTQVSATLAEWHDLVRRTRFNVFASQGDGRRIMQETTMGVLNRKVDQDIVAALALGTVYLGTTATTMSLNLAMYGLAALGNNAVPVDGNITCLITPAAYAYLMQTKEFANVEYTSNKPFDGSPTSFRWAGINWIVHNLLPGAGTSSETLFMFHKSAVGHGCDTQNIASAVGYDEEQDYSFARATAFMGSKLLQSKGVVAIRHDGSAFATTA
jgi:hypothetical protein